MKRYAMLYPNPFGIYIFCGFLLFLGTRELVSGFSWVSVILLGFMGLVFSIALLPDFHILRSGQAWRYDRERLEFLRCRWAYTHWEILETVSHSQMQGIASENIYLDGNAKVGKIWLVDLHGNRCHLIAQDFPTRHGNLAAEAEAQRIAKKVGLPLLSHDNVQTETPTARPASPHDFQAALSPKTANWVILAHWFWTLVFLAASAAVVQLALAYDHPAKYLVLAADLFLVAIGLVIGARALKMMNDNRVEQTWQLDNPHGLRPQRNAMITRKSGEFVLFSRAKYVVWTAIFCVIALLLTINNFNSWKNIVFLLIIWSGLLALLVPIWQDAFRLPKLVYSAETDMFTLYRLSKNLTWQPEKTMPVSQFIGLSRDDGALWLIAGEQDEDVSLGKAFGFSEYPNDRTWRVAKQIAITTGLPLLERKKIN